MERRKEPNMIPSLQEALRWAIFLRIVVLSAVLVPGMAILYGPGSEFISVRFFLFFVIAVVFSFLEFIYARQARSLGFQVYSHLLFDLIVVSSIVDATGSVGSRFTFLYIPLILEAGLFLGRGGAVMWATVSSFAYLFLGIFRFWGEGPLITDVDIAGGFPAGVTAHPLLDVFFPLSLFYLVALTIGFISSRLGREGQKAANLGRELRRLSLESSDILYNIPTGVLTCDLAGRLIFANPAGLELLGLEGESVIGRPARTVLGLRWKALREAVARTLKEGTPVLRAEIDAAGDGSNGGGAAHLGVSTSLLRDLNGELLGVTAIFQDISYRRRIEVLSRRTLRLKALTELSASMALEIRDPMATIRSTLDRLERCEAPEERWRLLDVIRNETGHISGLLDDFLRFARIRVRQWRQVDLLKLIEEIKALVLVRPDVASRIAFYLDGFQGEGRDVVWGDPELLKQVFLHLFVNAAEAIAGHGNIRVRFEGGASAGAGGNGEPDYMRILVEDDGPGLKEEVSEKAFDPFFSTKEDGAGLGLAIAHRIIEAHRGRIEIGNRRGKGCRCTLDLPARNPSSREG